jgi:ADP-heptose:LPS heptosyltransferase
MHGTAHDDDRASKPVRGPGYSVDFWKWYEEFAVPRLKSWPVPSYHTRVDTFRMMFEHLDRFDRPVMIIETGCAERLNDDGWGGNGCSTLLFDEYVKTHPGSKFWSVDIDAKSVGICRAAVSRDSHVLCLDSVEFLKRKAGDSLVIDLLYLDATNLNWAATLMAQKHHLDELLASMPMLRPDTLVAVDDSPIVLENCPYIEVGGKGGLVARYAAEVGAEQVFQHYQAGWVGMVSAVKADPVPSDTVNLKEMLGQASGHYHAGRVLDANNLFRLIYTITKNPETTAQRVARGESCFFFAKIAASQKKLGTAFDWYQEAIKCIPDAVEYILEMVGQTLRPMRHWDRAINEAIVATRIEPDNVHAWRMLGGLYLWSEKLEEAKSAFRRAMEVDPDAVEPKLDMISALFDDEPTKEVYAEAERLAHEVRFTKFPATAHGDATLTLAFTAYREGRHEDAIELYDEALEAGVSEPATCHWNKSLSLHALGRYREGWKEHTWRAVERTQLPLYVPVNRFDSPMWNGELLPARIHVHAEAGFGDNLCCSRYLQLLTDKGYDVRYEAYENMLSLMQRSFPAVKMVPQAIDYPGAIGIEAFDYHIPIGELPHVFGTEVDTVPWFGPYLHADPDLTAKYRDLFTVLPDGPKIGLCWSSGIREGLWITRYGKRKSMHFDDLNGLSDLMVGRGCYVSLQVGPERHQRKGLVMDMLPEKPSWDDTAALIANLDLVISVDTAVVHLAAAMGKPVWLMNSAEPGSWHWMAERPGSPWNERSPWYPSVRIYRQKMVGVWDDVVERVAADLKRGVG